MQEDSDARSDAELIQAAGADATAFGTLYERHALSVHTWCHRHLEWAASDLTAETFAQGWLSRDRFRDEHGGSALPWLLGIARNVLRETVRHDRVETRARRRLGLPLDLAAEDGYAAVEEKLSPPRLLRRSISCPDTSATHSSSASWMNCRTTRSRNDSRFDPQQHDSESRALYGA